MFALLPPIHELCQPRPLKRLPLQKLPLAHQSYSMQEMLHGTSPPSYFTANWQGRISVDWCGNTPLIEHHRCSCWKPWFVTHDNGAGSFLKVGCCFWKMWIRRRNKNYHNKGAWHLVFRYVPQVLLEPCPYLDPNTRWPPTLMVALHHGRCVKALLLDDTLI